MMRDDHQKLVLSGILRSQLGAHETSLPLPMYLGAVCKYWQLHTRCCELWRGNRIFIIHICCFYCIQQHLFEVCRQSRRCCAMPTFRMPVNQFNRSPAPSAYYGRVRSGVYCVFLARRDDESSEELFESGMWTAAPINHVHVRNSRCPDKWLAS